MPITRRSLIAATAGGGATADYGRVLATTPGEEALRPLGEGGGALVLG